MRAWLFQKHEQKLKLGDDAPWCVGWYDTDGKRRSKRIGAKSHAEKYRRKVEGELAAGTYRNNQRKQWAAFIEEFKSRIASGMHSETRRETLGAVAHFERIAKPRRMSSIRTQTIDDYIAQRRTEPGRKKGDTVSPATINKELRHLKAVLNIANEWGYLATMPKLRMLREPSKLATFVTPEHFAEIYQACDSARHPKGLAFPPADWWRALFTFAYMTGWRVSEPLALRRDDVDLEGGYAITRHEDNKGRRDDRTRLHAVVVEHLRRIACFEPNVFPWYHHERTLWSEFARIQKAAGIHLPCREDHEHTEACHLYGFHDFRRAFATVNAPTLSAGALQSLMRHKSWQTTRRYINSASELEDAVESLSVPPILRAANA